MFISLLEGNGDLQVPRAAHSAGQSFDVLPELFESLLYRVHVEGQEVGQIAFIDL